MQEEQRSLSSVDTISVRGLLMDRCVRWQVITIVVVNIGMQLSGIDAVSVKSIVGLSSFAVFVCVCSHFGRAKTVLLLYESESLNCYSSQLCSTRLHLVLSIHHSPTCSRWATKQGATGPRLIISWSSLLVLPHIRRSSHPHTKSNTSLFSLLHVDGSSTHAGSHANTISQQGYTPLSLTVPAVSDGNTGRLQTSRRIHLSEYPVVLSLKWKHACCSEDLWRILFMQITSSSLAKGDVTKWCQQDVFHSMFNTDFVELLRGSGSTGLRTESWKNNFSFTSISPSSISL